jgi:hypothetical protein
MERITLNTIQSYQENTTSKYWRTIECKPQTVELKSWSSNHPFFILNGIITESHDKTEIGKHKEIYIQTYSFYLKPNIDNGIYTIN